MNKIVVITGASSGIGLELYNLYKENGDIPINLSRTNSENLENFIECDVTKEEMVISAIKQIQQKYKKIDILINNAGFGMSGAIELEKSYNVQNIIDVNFMGAFYCYKYALPLMGEGAKIINMSSVCALFPIPYRGFYCSSKAGLSNLSYCEYMELKKSKINVVTICPGKTHTNFSKNRIKNSETNERYLANMKEITECNNKIEQKGMKPEKVAYKIFKQSYKKNPKPLKIIGFKFKLLYFLYKILPLRAFLFFTNKFLGK